MSTYRRFGQLPFYKSDQERDWQLFGYYNNWRLGIINVPRDELVSFRTPLISGSYTAPITMIIRKLKVISDVVEVISEQEITSDLVQSVEGDYTYYWREQGVFSEDSNDHLTAGCIYDIYIEDSNDNKFISAIFKAFSESELILGTEDGHTLGTEDGYYIGI